MSKPNLLLVDADDRNRRVLEVSLRKAGFLVTTAVDGGEALQKVEQAKPDLVIADTQLPEIDGFTLCAELKRDERFDRIPVILLSAERSVVDRVRGLELGADEYLFRPVFIKEVVARCRMLLDRREREDMAREPEQGSISGTLAQMSVVDLLQMMELGSKSGVIHLRGVYDKRGAMYFRDGKVIDAELGHLQGENAVYRLLIWTQADFEVEFKTIRRKDVVEHSNEHLLLEGMRRVDEWGRLLEQLPPLDTVFEIDYKTLGERLGEIPDEVNSIIRLFDGRRPLMQVVDDGDHGDVEALEVISKLYFEGLIIDITRDQDGAVARESRRLRLTPEQVGLVGDRAQRSAESVRHTQRGYVAEERGKPAGRTTGALFDEPPPRPAPSAMDGLGIPQPELTSAAELEAMEALAGAGGPSDTHDDLPPLIEEDFGAAAEAAAEEVENRRTEPYRPVEIERPIVDDDQIDRVVEEETAAAEGFVEALTSDAYQTDKLGERGESFDEADEIVMGVDEALARTAAEKEAAEQAAAEKAAAAEAAAEKEKAEQAAAEQAAAEEEAAERAAAEAAAEAAAAEAAEKQAAEAAEAEAAEKAAAKAAEKEAAEQAAEQAAAAEKEAAEQATDGSEEGEESGNEGDDADDGAGSGGRRQRRRARKKARRQQKGRTTSEQAATSASAASGAQREDVAEEATTAAPEATKDAVVDADDAQAAPLAEEEELDRWLSEDEASERGHVIPFPGGRSAAGRDEVAEEINRAAEEAAERDGNGDPSAASINVHDEAFFASDYEPDPYSDQLFADFDDERPRGGRGKWIGVAFLLLAALVGAPVYYYGVHTNPYFGDGPPHLQVDPNRIGTRASIGDAATPAVPKKVASKVDAKVVKPATKVVKVSVDAGAPKQDSAVAKVAADAAVAKADAKAVVAKPESTPDAGVNKPDAATAKPSADEQYAALITQAREFFKKRRVAQGYRLLFKAQKLKPDGWEALERLAWREYNRGRMAQGRALAKKALVGNPKAPYANLVEAAAAHEKGNKAAAKAGYQIFLDGCPACPEVRDIKEAMKSL